MSQTKAISLADLNVTKKCEEGYEFEYLDANGNSTGVFITVVGAHAPQIQKWVNTQLNQRRKHEAMQAKRGKDVERLIEDDIEFGVEFMAIRITGWRGINEPCTPENALVLCESNPLAVEQVKAASENLANFTRSK